MRYALLVLCVLAGCAGSPPRPADEKPFDSAAGKPNFILIFTDDQGYQDLGCFGSPKIKTPNIDRMAQQGRKFTDFYVAESVCSPSRAALLTGCYPPRAGVTRVLYESDVIGLNPARVTIAEVLRQRGYATACIGKWHLGHKPVFLPTRQGFDSYFGVPYSNDMRVDRQAAVADDCHFRQGMTLEKMRHDKVTHHWVPLMRNEKIIEYPADQSTLTRRYTEEAIAFIEKNKDRPFFLYLPHTMPHIPLFASEQFTGHSAIGPYGDVLEEIDWSVGRILAKLKALGLDENTLVIYTSDNGPWKLRPDKNGHVRGGWADPLRGAKFGVYEGGYRVPCVMRWPGRIPAGTVCSEIAGTIDLLPTFAHLAGAPLPTERILDGRDIRPLILDEPGAKTPHGLYCYYKKEGLAAVRSGKWKLLLPRKWKNKDLPMALYDLSADIGESNDLAEQRPDVVKRLTEMAKQFDAELQANKGDYGKAN